MLIIITGDGKGKTTSALGQALRVIGDGGKAIMYQFIKGPWISGEDKIISKIKNPAYAKPTCRTGGASAGRQISKIFDFEIIKGGIGFVGIQGDNHKISEHKKAAFETWLKAKKAIESKKYDLIILDELNVALHLKLLNLWEILKFLKKNRSQVNIMITGRYAPKKILELGDIVSEIKDIKHPFHKGSGARKGIEY